jgi:hydrogenase nickel incorporation protein HypB
MCTTCGCGQGETRIEGEAHAHEHVHADGTVHSHAHDHGHDHEHPHDHAHDRAHAHPHDHPHEHPHEHPHDHPHDHDHTHDHGQSPPHARIGAQARAHAHAAPLHYGLGPAGAHAPGISQARMVQIERDILSKNDALAAENRRRFADAGVFAVNLVSSPGSGKTTLLVRTIQALEGRFPVAVIEGDQQTSNDAERIRATGAPAIQVNTGKGCHLDAQMVGRAAERLALGEGSLLLVENVGNLVCPAGFDLGEDHKVVILSVTEGEDKPLKYPDMFRAADLMLLAKIDLLPHLDFDVEQCVANARRVNPGIEVIRVSARSGEGLAQWLAWLDRGVHEARERRAQTLDALRQRVAELEAKLGARN